MSKYWSPPREQRALREHLDPITGTVRPVRYCDRCEEEDYGWSRGVGVVVRSRQRLRRPHLCGREWLLLMLPCGAARRRVYRCY